MDSQHPWVMSVGRLPNKSLPSHPQKVTILWHLPSYRGTSGWAASHAQCHSQQSTVWELKLNSHPSDYQSNAPSHYYLIYVKKTTVYTHVNGRQTFAHRKQQK